MRTPQRDGRAVHRSRSNRTRTISLPKALEKPHVRLLAFDDGPFRRGDQWAALAAVLWSVPDQLEGMALGRLRVDGLDATEAMLRLTRTARFEDGPRAILLDGITVGGFNVVDLDRLHRRSGRPVISVTRHRPDYEAMRAALVQYFPRSFRARWRRVRAHRLFSVELGGSLRYAAAVGCRRRDAVELLRRATVRGGWPEPLRLAGMLAHAALREAERTPARARREARGTPRG